MRAGAVGRGLRGRRCLALTRGRLLLQLPNSKARALLQGTSSAGEAFLRRALIGLAGVGGTLCE